MQKVISIYTLEGGMDWEEAEIVNDQWRSDQDTSSDSLTNDLSDWLRED